MPKKSAAAAPAIAALSHQTALTIDRGLRQPNLARDDSPGALAAAVAGGGVDLLAVGPRDGIA
jgi:hypothetical protein